MKGKGFGNDGLSIILALAAAAVFAGITAFYKPEIALGEAVIILLVAILALVRKLFAKRRYISFLRRVTGRLDFSEHKVLSSFPFPVAVCNPDGIIDWCSDSFIREVSGEKIVPGTSIDDYTNNIGMSALESEGEVAVNLGNRYFSVQALSYGKGEKKFTVFYFIDNTHLKKTEFDFYKAKPYAIVIELDNIDDSRAGFRDSEKSEIKRRIEAMLDEWSESFNSFMKRTSEDRYLIITEKENINLMTEERFSILEKVRNYRFNDKNTGITLSMGVACGDNIKQGEKNARKALELALGRGGDQVAIKNEDSYEFIGGVSKSAEKRDKAKTRLVGSAIAQMISQSSGVFICGHSSSDIDSIGAALGIAYASGKLGIPAHILIENDTTLALPLIEKAQFSDWGGCFTDVESAEKLLNKNSLFIMVDTHNPALCEYPELFEKSARKIIIDHHRLSPDSDDGITDLFYQDAGASSTCEMVTELLPYILNDDDLPKFIAEALLAGIMLDTKNFVVRAGVRTFEAAAYLKDKDADTIAVKRLFSGTLEDSINRNNVVSSADLYKGCAVATVDGTVASPRIIASKAADELLNVQDITASFVIFNDGNDVCVCARSLGDMNVQLVMEDLGGGGHRTMAACRIESTDIQTVKEKIYEEINKFRKN